MRVVVTGGAGTLGRALVPLLSSRDHDVTVITRTPARSSSLSMLPRVFVEPGDPQKPGPWQTSIARADAVIHLAAPSLFEAPHSAARQQQLLAGRLATLQEVVKAITQAPTPPRVLLVASSTSIYGDRRDLVDERAPAGSGWLAEIFARTEALAVAVRPKTRVVMLRLGQILAPGGRLLSTTSGAALPEPSHIPFTFVHVADAALLSFRALMSSLDQPLNVVGTPTTILGLHKALGLSTPPAPSGLGRLFRKAEIVAPEIVLAGQQVRSSFAQSLDYYATYADIGAAVKACRKP